MTPTNTTDAFSDIRARLASGEWWLIPVTSGQSKRFARAVLDRFYSGDDEGRRHKTYVVGMADGRRVPLSLFRKTFAMPDEVRPLMPGGRIAGNVLFTPDTPLAARTWVRETFGPFS